MMEIKLCLYCACFTLVLLGTSHAQTVTSLSRTRSILAGGLRTTVTGTGFAANQAPAAVISLYYQGSLYRRFTGVTCTVTSQVAMACTLPEISQLPETPPNVLAGDNALLNQAGVIEFKAGVTFTSSTQAHLEVQDINMYANPDFSATSIERVFSVWTNRVIHVEGAAVLAGVDAADYVVDLNDQPTTIGGVNNTHVEARLSSVIPTPNDGAYTTIVITVGALQVQVGRIWYRVPEFSTALPLPVITFNPADFASRIEVNGTNLFVGLTADDYTVNVGTGQCTDVVITPTTLSCRGPVTSPSPDGRFTQSPDNYPQLIISVPTSGMVDFVYTYHPAYVRYLNHDYSRDSAVSVAPNNNGGRGRFDTQTVLMSGNGSSGDDDSSDTTLWVVIGICIAAALILLAFLVCCCCCCGCGAGRRGLVTRRKEDSVRYLDSSFTSSMYDRRYVRSTAQHSFDI